MPSPLQSPATDPTCLLLKLGLALAGLSGAFGVTLLALSAHAHASSSLQTAAQMLLFHAPAFLGLGLLAQLRQVVLLPVAFLSLTAGLALFCGDLALRTFAGQRLFAMAAPAGGLLVILSWLAVAIGALRVRPKSLKN